MTRIKILKNENKLVERKTTFFVDYFNFYAKKIGKYYETELENPLSLVEKIIFQLTENPHDRKVNYINNYLSHEYFIRDKFLKQFKKYLALKPNIISYRAAGSGDSADKTQLRWLRNNGDFLKELKSLKLELENEMCEKSLKILINFLLCDHDLKKHHADIKTLTKILVTESFFTERHKSEVLNIFSRLLSSDINQYPFPENVKTEIEKQDYLKTGNFQKQFEGFLDFLKENPVNHFLILKVYGATLQPQKSFKYNAVEFLSSHHKKIEKLKTNVVGHDESMHVDFFDGEDYLFAVIPTKVFNDAPILDSVKRIVQKEVGYLSLRLDRQLRIDFESYLLTPDFEHCIWKTYLNKIKTIEDKDIKTINDNPFFFLKKYSGPGANHILYHEEAFINASINNLIESYWKYIENILSFKRTPASIIDTVSSLLLLNEKYFRKEHIHNYLLETTTPWQFDYAGFGLEPHEIIQLRKELSKSQSKNFFKKIDYPFLKELEKIETKRHTKNRNRDIKNYYIRILLEVYEYRNAITHANVINQKADIKLQFCMPDLISRFRWILFQYVRKYPKAEFKSLINSALIEAEKLI